jgi:superfamily II DNA helicase RecQ
LDTKEKFGLLLPIGVLTGSKSKRMEKIQNSQQLKCFGKGAKYSQEWWKELAYQCVEVEGLLKTELVRSKIFSFEKYVVTLKGLQFLSTSNSPEAATLNVTPTQKLRTLHLLEDHAARNIFGFSSVTQTTTTEQSQSRTAPALYNPLEEPTSRVSMHYALLIFLTMFIATGALP